MSSIRSVFSGLVALAIPLVVLALVEGGLRLADVAAPRRTAFVEVPGRTDARVLAPSFAQRYFRGFRPAVAFTPFSADPEPDVFRVMVLGGSSVAGFPYQFYHGFPSHVEAALQAAHPTRRIEVVNLGMTAVNSYTLWDLVPHVIDEAPDAVLIYAGHNEYYGALGVGSAFYGLGHQVWLKRLLLRLKDLALFVLLEDLLLGSPDPGPVDPQARTTMARAVRDAGIVFDGPAYEAGVDQFVANMEAVLDALGAAGMPVYLGTLTANLADQPPLGEAVAAAEAYAEGQALQAAGDTAAARVAFQVARTYDDLRFRAPPVFNEHLRQFGAQEHVTVVDIEALFQEASPGGLEGASLFTDHLHPTAEGYALMGHAFAEALGRHPALQGTIAPAISALERSPSPDPIDATLARLQIARLMVDYPFQKEATPEGVQRAFGAVLEEARTAGTYTDSLAATVFALQQPMQAALAAGMQRARAEADTVQALRLYHALFHWQPFNATLMQEAVGYALGQARYDSWTQPLALFAAQRTGALYHYNALAAIQLRNGYTATAAPLLDYVETRDPSSAVMLFNQTRRYLAEGDTLTARGYARRYQEVATSR
ncbi:MAG: GDSL-type esterase/lipase family protein [Bacteroidota bacterium]